jgi:hypothetical protein
MIVVNIIHKVLCLTPHSGHGHLLGAKYGIFRGGIEILKRPLIRKPPMMDAQSTNIEEM